MGDVRLFASGLLIPLAVLAAMDINPFSSAPTPYALRQQMNSLDTVAGGAVPTKISFEQQSLILPGAVVNLAALC